MTDPSPLNSNQPSKVTAKDGHVYHKSATANATTAPTNAHTVANANKQGNLTKDQLDFVTIVHYEFGLRGQLPTDSDLSRDYAYSKSELADLFNNDLIIEALDERGVTISHKQLEPVGIPFSKPEPKHNPKLTPLQLIVANTMLDLTDTRSDKKKLQDAGVTTAKYQSWLRDPDFNEYLRERAESMIGDMQHEAMLSLADSVRAGKMDAIKYYHELTGRYVQQSSSNSGQASNHDMQNIIIRIVEIIIDEVDDPDTAARIGDRLKGLVTGAQVAGMITDNNAEPIAQPEIAKARELTPEVKALMNNGVGYDQ